MQALVFLLPWSFVLLVGCGLVAIVARIATARAAGARRAALERMGTAGDAVMRQGRLRVEGEGTESNWRSKAKLAAFSRVESFRRLWPRDARVFDHGHRCEQLWLDTKDGPVLLRGDIEVEVGSRQRWLGTRSEVRFHHEHAVFDGDEVVVVGERAAAPVTGAPEQSGYRAQAASEVLEPLSESGSIAVAALASRPVLRWRQLVRHPLVLLAALAAAVPSCRAAKDYEDTADVCATNCEHSGRCAAGLARGERWSWWDVLRGKPFTCVANDDTCRRASSCRSAGTCSAVDGDCAAAVDDDCRHADACFREAKCSAVDGECRAMRDEDCRRTIACGTAGRCAAIGGSCGVGSDADCGASDYCRSLGHCRKVGDECQASSDDDCHNTSACDALGHCTARSGDCVLANDEDCGRTRECRVEGQCTFVQGQGCVAADAEDCLRSEECAGRGYCRAENGLCVQDGPCATSAACRVHGHCGGESFCVPRSARDCEQSERCKKDGACKLLSRVCAKSCTELHDCRERGSCSEIDGECRAASDADCSASRRCRIDGTCTAQSGACVAGKPEDCRRSADCKEYGRCTQQGIDCVATDADCAAGSLCRSLGMCVAKDGRCDDGGADEHCAQSAECKERGRCQWGSSGCVAGTHDHCRQSEVCHRFGWCHKVDDGCFIAPL